eukprot:12935826-Prorocentrum_lima.AAC.1
MGLKTCVVETGNHGHDCRIKLHLPKEMGEDFVHEQEFKLRSKWEAIRPDVPCEWSDKYHKRGDLDDGMYAEIHKVEHQDLV